jgi:hypothetical protein
LRGPSCGCFSSAIRIAALAAIASVWGATPARAEWFVTPFLGVKFGGTTNLVDLEQGASNSKWMLGAAAGIVSDGLFGVEADFGYYPRFFERSAGSGLIARSHAVTLMGNVIVAVPRSVTGLSLRPFVSGGAGLLNVSVDDVAGILAFNSNLFAINAGGGATGALTRRTSVRLELRYFKSVTREDEDSLAFGPSRLSFWRAAVGLTVR